MSPPPTTTTVVRPQAVVGIVRPLTFINKETVGYPEQGIAGFLNHQEEAEKKMDDGFIVPPPLQTVEETPGSPVQTTPLKRTWSDGCTDAPMLVSRPRWL